MAARCSCCGQTLPPSYGTRLIYSADELVLEMAKPVPMERKAKDDPITKTHDVYEGYKNGKYPTGYFYLTYRKGVQATPGAVRDAIKRGLIVPTWPNRPDDSWSLPEQAERNRIRYEEVEAKRTNVMSDLRTRTDTASDKPEDPERGKGE